MLVLCQFTHEVWCPSVMFAQGEKKTQAVQDSIMLRVDSYGEIIPRFEEYVASKAFKNPVLTSYKPQIFKTNIVRA